MLARGLLGGVPAGSGGKGSEAAAAALAALGASQPPVAWDRGALYCPDRAAIVKAGADGWSCVPEGAESLLAQPLLPFGTGGTPAAGPARGVLLLVSERPRALSGKERAWAAAVAAKLHAALAQA